MPLTVEHNDQSIPKGKRSSEMSIDIKRPFLKDLWRVLTRQHIHIKFQFWTHQPFEQGDIRMNTYTVLPKGLTKIVKIFKHGNNTTDSQGPEK